MAHKGEQGTGKHPHSRRDSTEKVQQASGPGTDPNDLKSREYRDKDGQIHHHTRTYERDHPGKSR